MTLTFFRAQEPKAPVTYCDHALSGVHPASVRRLSSVRLYTFSTSSPEPLDGFWWNLVWMKYSRSLTSVVVFRPDPSRGWIHVYRWENAYRKDLNAWKILIQGGAKIGHGGSPSSRNFFFRPEGYSNKPNA